MSDAVPKTHTHPAGEHHPRDGEEFTEQLNEENRRLGHGHHTKAEQDQEQDEARQRREEHYEEIAKTAHESALHPRDREQQ